MSKITVCTLCFCLFGYVLRVNGADNTQGADGSKKIPASEAISDFPKEAPANPQALADPVELARDDGTSAGKRSMAGSGHAVRFEAPGKECYLTAVRIFGSRYGYPAPPNENAFVWLCDRDFKMIAAFPFPYASFERGEPKWVSIPVKATRVPQQFIVCAGFNPTATKGVYVHYDAAGCGQSICGLPGKQGPGFEKGDWMVRAVVRENKR